jgi:hypothetical protein
MKAIINGTTNIDIDRFTLEIETAPENTRAPGKIFASYSMHPSVSDAFLLDKAMIEGGKTVDLHVESRWGDKLVVLKFAISRSSLDPVDSNIKGSCYPVSSN